MIMKRALGAMVMSALLVTGTIALASPAYMSTGNTSSGWAAANFAGAPNSLANAISALELKLGGKVLEIRYTNVDGRPGFYAVVAANGALTHAQVDAATDQVTPIGAGTPDWMLTWEGRADVSSISKATVPLSQAIETAEKAFDGPAIDAGLAQPLSGNNAVLAYNIAIVRDGHAKRVAVDANTDQVIADPDMLRSWAPE